jgi:hypothetical protein
MRQNVETLDMTDGKRWAFRVVAVVVFLISLAAQIFLVFAVWFIAGPRPRCDHLIGRGQWIACMHELPYFILAERCLIVWLIAGISGLLARFLPPYISAIVPVGLAVAYAWFLYANFELHGGVFVTIAALFMAGPVAGAWLWGISFRGRRRALLRLSAVFDSAT